MKRPLSSFPSLKESLDAAYAVLDDTQYQHEETQKTFHKPLSSLTHRPIRGMMKMKEEVGDSMRKLVNHESCRDLMEDLPLIAKQVEESSKSEVQNARHVPIFSLLSRQQQRDIRRLPKPNDFVKGQIKVWSRHAADEQARLYDCVREELKKSNAADSTARCSLSAADEQVSFKMPSAGKLALVVPNGSVRCDLKQRNTLALVHRSRADHRAKPVPSCIFVLKQELCFQVVGINAAEDLSASFLREFWSHYSIQLISQSRIVAEKQLMVRGKIEELVSRWGLNDSTLYLKMQRTRALDAFLDGFKKLILGKLRVTLTVWKRQSQRLRQHMACAQLRNAIILLQSRTRCLQAKKERMIRESLVKQQAEAERLRLALEQQSRNRQATKIQAVLRGHSARLILHEKRRAVASATRVQRFWRIQSSKTILLLLRASRDLQHINAITLQCFCRKVFSCQKLTLLKKLQQYARLERMNRIKLRKIGMKFLKEGAVILIQRGIRGAFQRQQNRLLQELTRRKCAVIIQCHVRRVLARSKFAILLSENEMMNQNFELASVKIQQSVRRYLAALQYNDMKAVMESQVFQRKREKKLKLSQTKGIAQKKGLHLLSLKKLKFQALMALNKSGMEHRAAMLLQRSFRMYRARKRKAVKLKQLLEEMRQMRKRTRRKSAIDIQRVYRGCVVRSEQRSLVLHAHQKKSLFIVLAFLKRIGVKKRASDQALQYRSACVLQQNARAFLSNQSVLNIDRIRSLRIVTYLQRCFHRFRRKRQLVASLLSMQHRIGIRAEGAKAYQSTLEMHQNLSLSARGVHRLVKIMSNEELSQAKKRKVVTGTELRVRSGSLSKLLMNLRTIVNSYASRAPNVAILRAQSMLPDPTQEERCLERYEVDVTLSKLKNRSSNSLNVQGVRRCVVELVRRKLELNGIAVAEPAVYGRLFTEPPSFAILAKFDSSDLMLCLFFKVFAVPLQFQLPNVEMTAVHETLAQIETDVKNRVATRVRCLQGVYRRYKFRVAVFAVKARFRVESLRITSSSAVCCIQKYWRSFYCRRTILSELVNERYIKYVKHDEQTQEQVSFYYYDTKLKCSNYEKPKLVNLLALETDITTIFVLPNRIQTVVPVCVRCNSKYLEHVSYLTSLTRKDYHYYEMLQQVLSRRKEEEKYYFKDTAEIACFECCAYYCAACNETLHSEGASRGHHQKQVLFCAVCRFQGSSVECFTCLRYYCDICFQNTHYCWGELEKRDLSQLNETEASCILFNAKPLALRATVGGAIRTGAHLVKFLTIRCDACKNLTAKWTCQACKVLHRQSPIAQKNRAVYRYCTLCFQDRHHGHSRVLEHVPRYCSYSLLAMQRAETQLKMNAQSKQFVKDYNRARKLRQQQKLLDAAISLQSRFRARCDRLEVNQQLKQVRQQQRRAYQADKRDTKVRGALQYKLKNYLNIAPILETDSKEQKHRKEMGWKATKLGQSLLKGNLMYHLELVNAKLTVARNSTFCHCVLEDTVANTAAIEVGEWVKIAGFSYRIVHVSFDENQGDSTGAETGTATSITTRPVHEFMFELDYPFEGSDKASISFHRYRQLPKFMIQTILRKRKAKDKLQQVLDDYRS